MTKVLQNQKPGNVCSCSLAERQPGNERTLFSSLSANIVSQVIYFLQKYSATRVALASFVIPCSRLSLCAMWHSWYPEARGGMGVPIAMERRPCLIGDEERRNMVIYAVELSIR